MEYWIIKDNAPCGPFDEEQLAGLNITADTPVWYDGLSDWIPAADVKEFAGLVYNTIPSVPQEVIVEQVTVQPAYGSGGNEQVATVTATITEKPVIYVPADAIPAGYVPVMQGELKCPPTYLVWAILSTIICFLPLGVCAIIFSTKVKKSFNAGDYAKASKMSEHTALFIILSLVMWLIWMPFSVVISML